LLLLLLMLLGPIRRIGSAAGPVAERREAFSGYSLFRNILTR